MIKCRETEIKERPFWDKSVKQSKAVLFIVGFLIEGERDREGDIS